jgi:hypothetical protein
MKPFLLTARAAAGAIVVFRLVERYRRDLSAARARLAAVERHVKRRSFATNVGNFFAEEETSPAERAAS